MPDTDIGAHVVDTYRGWLVFASLPDDLQRAEDSTAAHDYHQALCGRGDPQWLDIGAPPGTPPYVPPADDPKKPAPATAAWYWLRDATSAERTLLGHLGYTLPPLPADGDPDPLQTHVSWCTETLRSRRWPTLETTT